MENNTRRQFKSRMDAKQDVWRAIPALMGDGNGTIQVPNQPNYVYIRVGDGDLGQAFNNRCPLRDNLAIYVGYDQIVDPDRRTFQVLSVRMADYAGAGDATVPNVGPHHETHEYGGGDDVFVSWRRLMGLRVGRPAVFVVTVDPGYIFRSGWIAVPSTTIDLTATHAALVGMQAQYILISLSSTGVVTATAGAVVPNLIALTIADVPTPPAGHIPLAAVRLYKVQTEIGDTPGAPDIIDLRFPTYGTAGYVYPVIYGGGGYLGAATWGMWDTIQYGAFIYATGRDVPGYFGALELVGDIRNANAGAGQIKFYQYDGTPGGLLRGYVGKTGGLVWGAAVGGDLGDGKINVSGGLYINNVAVAAGGGPHAILSATHTDTLADGVVDGDVIIGNVTPKWSRLAVSIPAANVRNVLGIDNGELRPSWKTALDATNPTNVSAGGAASPGTSLVFSHRDHTHGGPATWTATVHNVLDSTYHGDVLTGAITAGDVLIGNATPKIARLAITVPAAGICNYLGVNNAETLPSWKSASSNPGAAAAVLASNASGYLQLVRLGIGITPAYPLQVSATVTPSATYLSYVYLTTNQAGAADYGVASAFTVKNTGAGNITNNLTGFIATAAQNGAGTITLLRGAAFQVSAYSCSGNVTGAHALEVNAPYTLSHSGTVAELAGLYVFNQGSATITRSYAILIKAQTGSATNTYGIYAEGAANGSRLGHQLALVGSTDVQQFTCTGFSTQAVATPVAQVTRADAAAGVSAMLGLTCLGSGADLDGGKFLLRGGSSTTPATEMASLKWQWYSATHATRKADIWATAWDTSEREIWRGRGTGTAAAIGFLGAAPIARYSSTGDLRQCLIDFGLYTTGGASPLNLNGGALTSGGATVTAGRYIQTFTLTSSVTPGMYLNLTGSGVADNYGLNITIAAGNTGGNQTIGAIINNYSAGTGTAAIQGGAGNYGFFGNTSATTSGDNVGAGALAVGGNRNYGGLFWATSAKNSATNIGAIGLGLNTGTSPIQIGGYFGLQATQPTFISAALCADNGAQTDPIFVGRNNGVVTFSIDDADNVKIAGTALRGTTEGTNHLDIFDGTAPVGTLANGCSLYSAAGELYAMDAAGNATPISPHDKQGEWIFLSKNTVTGRVLKIDMERMMKALNAKFNFDFIHEYVER